MSIFKIISKNGLPTWIFTFILMDLVFQTLIAATVMLDENGEFIYSILDFFLIRKWKSTGSFFLICPFFPDKYRESYDKKKEKRSDMGVV